MCVCAEIKLIKTVEQKSRPIRDQNHKNNEVRQ